MTDQTGCTPKDCIMSAPADAPLKLEYRPDFDSLPYHSFDVSDNTALSYHSFPFLPGYRQISFEEQRLEDMKPPPPMATRQVGMFTPSALKSLRAAYPNFEATPGQEGYLLEPMLPLARIRVTGGNHDPRVFAIHSNILKHRSPFFKTLLESDTRAVGTNGELDEERSSEQDMTPIIEFEGSIIAFRLYAEWIYSGRVPRRLSDGEGSTEDTSLHNIGQAYILGERLQDHRFNNAIVDFLLEAIITQRKMDLTLPTLVFEKTSVSAPLRKLLVDFYVLYGHKDWLKPTASNETISAVFLSDLATAFLARKYHDSSPTTNVSMLNGCQYHEHPNGKLCPFGGSHPREVVKQKP